MTCSILRHHFARIFALLLCCLCLASSVTRAQQLPPSLSGVQVRQTPPPPKVGEGTDEDFESLSLEGKELASAIPEIGEHEENSALTQEMVRVEWRTNDPIYLFILKPTGVTKPPVILYLYSYPSETDRFLDTNFGKFLTRNGYAAVGFAASMTGQRYHDRPMKEWFVSNLQEALVSTTHDVQMILNYLDARGDLDMDRVGMFGDGSGATIAALAAGVDPRIKAIDLLNPWGDWPEWMAKSSLIPDNERPDYLRADFLKSIAQLDPVQWLPKLTSTHVRLQMIQKGVSVTPDAARQRIRDAVSPNTTVVEYQDTQDFAKRIASTGTAFDWIKEQVSAGAGTYRASDAASDRPSPKPTP